jgi:hypothetical protein
MHYSFKTEEDGKGDRSRNFIFNDLQFHSVFEGENAFIDIDTDMKAKQNWLRFTKRRPTELTEKDGGVLSLLASVKGCLTYFQNGARNLSFNYKHHKDEDKRPGDDDYTFENAIESVLTEFHLSREQIRYPEEFLKDFKGIVVCDGYSAYRKLDRENPDIVFAGCWSHARRRFAEALKALPKAAQKNAKETDSLRSSQPDRRDLSSGQPDGGTACKSQKDVPSGQHQTSCRGLLCMGKRDPDLKISFPAERLWMGSTTVSTRKLL